MAQVWLQHLGDYDSISLLDTRTCRLEDFSRAELDDDKIPSTSGFIARSCSECMAVFSLNGRFAMLLGTRLVLLKDSDVICLSMDGVKRQLVTLDRDGQKIAEVCYIVADRSETGDDLTAFVEEEDYDIGLLAKNIFMSRKRREIFTSR